MRERHHRFFTREELRRLGFTREWMRERDKIGWGGSEPKPEWRPSGQVITSPVDLWEVEEARDDAGRERMGKPVPVHLFLWSVLPPVKPWLTKLGGVPWRPADRPWPRTKRGDPCTFIAQFCFADSRALVSPKLPGDVLLVFFEDGDSWTGKSVVLEWSSLEIGEPFAAAEVPAPQLTVPQFSGVIYEFDEYPDGHDRAYEAVEERGHCFLIAETQSTKIGRASFFIQNDPRKRGEELLCTLSSVYPEDCGSLFKEKRQTARWPLLDLERYAMPPATPDAEGWSAEVMTFADGGALYFLVDRKGRVRMDGDSG